ncbi:hypothetical protein AURDEDRAFT_164899 [Auricularia subglabra TFB-10046 SS5]|nr:hypothetical protein AURDEDRAFT_164899 [Auricularia subglabra TFB-10046 SS5]
MKLFVALAAVLSLAAPSLALVRCVCGSTLAYPGPCKAPELVNGCENKPINTQ